MSEISPYSEKELLRLARRVNNPKRNYLLVNPLQGKHMPVDPEEALKMMQALGKTVKSKRAGIPLVIGFSETATAIGAAVAVELGEQCVYLQTTREQDDCVSRWVCFSEEHSHATEQKLCGDGLESRISACDYVLLIDDEISTGKTILNTVSAIRKACPSAGEKEFVVASLINRVDKDHLEMFSREGVSFLYLLHLDAADFEERVEQYTVREAEPPRIGKTDSDRQSIVQLSAVLPAPHRGVTSGEYARACQRCADEILQKADFAGGGSVLVLGTEEFMYPALQLAARCRAEGAASSVKIHAVTRSPIGVSEEAGYPITNGIRLHSLYAPDRISYLYDLDSYDAVIVFSDAPRVIPEAVEELQKGLEENHCRRIQFFFGGRHV